MASEFLEVPGSLPDHTAASQRTLNPEKSGVSAADLRRGFIEHPVERTSVFSEDTTGENQVGNPFTYGGFLGRPPGTAR
jgi:hypothetical protein